MRHFHLFVPFSLDQDGPRGAQPLPPGCERIGRGRVHGTAYDLEGVGRVLMLYGNSPIGGEIWRCPADALVPLDRAAGVGAGKRRRVAYEVAVVTGGPAVPCWLYVAGPALSRSLLPDRRVPDSS